MAAPRSPEMIRASIEETRRELAFSVNDLRSKMTEITDWRGQLVRNRQAALVERRRGRVRDRRRSCRHLLRLPPPPLAVPRNAGPGVAMRCPRSSE